MRSLVSRYLLLPCVVLSFLVHPLPRLLAKEPSTEEIQTYLQRGVEQGLNLDDKGAVAELMKAVDLDRDNPIGYAYLAMADLFFYETSIDEKEKKNYETSMLKAVEDAQARAERKIEKDPRNG